MHSGQKQAAQCAGLAQAPGESGISVDLELELLLVHVLGLVWHDDEGVLTTGVALASHRGCITGPGNHGTPIPWLACHQPDCVTRLALQADICALVLHRQATRILILDESRKCGCQHLLDCRCTVNGR